MVLPDDIKELLRRDFPKKPIGELLQDLQRDLPAALKDFLSNENTERKNWINSQLEPSAGDHELIETEDSESHPEETTGLSEFYWLTNILKLKPASSAEHEHWAKQIEAGMFAQEELNKNLKLFDVKKRNDLEKIVEIGKSSSQLFILHNLRLVYSIARKSPRLLPIEEHFQNGIFGLFRSIQGWDWRQGFQFSTYATWWIRQSIYRALSDTAYTIRIPVHMLDLIRVDLREKKSTDSENSVSQNNGSDEEDKDLAASETNIFTNPMFLAKNAIYRSFSYEMVTDKYDFLLEYQVDPFEDTTFDYAVNSEFVDQLNQTLDTLSGREALIIRQRFGLVDGEAKTLDEIGLIFGLTRERIRQIEFKTIAKLRHPSRSKLLEGYLGSTLSGE